MTLFSISTPKILLATASMLNIRTLTASSLPITKTCKANTPPLTDP